MKLLKPLLALALLFPAAPAQADDLATLKTELQTRLDDADEALIGDVAKLGTRESMEVLVDLYGQMRSVFMRREIVRALPSYDGNSEAEQPALQHLMDVAVGAKERELRIAAIEGLGKCRGHGKTFLRMVVESPAMDEIREMAMELHVKRSDESDHAWYREIWRPTPVRSAEDDDRGKRRRNKKKDEEEEVEPEKVVHSLGSLRRMAFEAISSTLTEDELLDAFGMDPSMSIKVIAMNELADRDYKGLEPIASEILDNISLPAGMRAQAATILADVRGASIADHFIDLAKKQEVTQDHLRRRMGELLADMKNDKVNSATEKLLGKGKPHQRLFALIASRHNEEKKVVKKLVKALGDKDPVVWRLAVEIATERKFEDAEKELDKQLGKAKKDEERLVPLLVALTSIRGDKDDEWQEQLREYAVGEARETRNAAIRALAQTDGEEYLDGLKEALEHDDWSTRLAALKGLESIRTPAVLEPIIARMEHENGRLLVEFADALWRMTGKPYRTRANAWAAWYQDEGDGFELIEERDLRKLEEEEENRRLRQITKVEFFGVRIESTRVIFIVDVSGSMNEALRGEYVGRPGEIRLAVAKRELKNAIEALEANALYNIITFSSGVDAWLDGVVGADTKSRDEAVEFIDRLGAGGATNLYDAVQTAFGDPDVDTIVILSDGEPTAGAVLQPGLIRENVARWNEHRGIKIHCVSVGGSLSILEWLAEDHGGTYVKFQ